MKAAINFPRIVEAASAMAAHISGQKLPPRTAMVSVRVPNPPQTSIPTLVPFTRTTTRLNFRIVLGDSFRTRSGRVATPLLFLYRLAQLPPQHFSSTHPLR